MLALPVNAPEKLVAVTVLNPAKLEVVAPNAIFVEPIVNALFANLLFAIAVPLQTPVVIVPTVVISVPINLEAVMLPANFALVILPSLTPAAAVCAST